MNKPLNTDVLSMSLIKSRENQNPSDVSRNSDYSKDIKDPKDVIPVS